MSNEMTAEEAEQIKQAEAELFTQWLAEKGVPMEKFASASDEDAGQAYALFQEELSQAIKQAEEEEEKKDEKKDEKEEEAKKESAYQEFLALKTAQEVDAQAEYMGRKIAHAMVDELQKLGGKGEGAAEAIGKAVKSVSSEAASAKGEGLKNYAKRKASEGVAAVKDKAKSTAAPFQRAFATGRGTASAGDAAKHKGSQALDRLKSSVNSAAGSAKEKAHAAASYLKANPAAAATVGAGALIGAGAAHKKESSANLNDLAAYHAVDLAVAADLDGEKVASAIEAMFTLDLFAEAEANTKVAAANDLDTAVHIRSLEILEHLGIPVTWNI